MEKLRHAIRKARSCQNRIVDRWLSIRTESFPVVSGHHLADSNPYESIHYGLLSRFLRPLAPMPDDIFYDIGCGMGRILCLASRLPVRMCIGIEIVPELAAIAEGNARMLRGRRSEIQVRIANAAEADYSDGTIYCMFNPFGAATMEKVLSRIGETLQESPRPVRLGYFNPVHENAFRSSGFLELTGRVEALLSAKTASYWTNWKWTGQKIPNHKFQITNNS